MSDPDHITDSDIDTRPTDFGQPVTDDDLMTYEEWWDEFMANACCPDSGAAYASFCPCGGTPIPSDISRLLAREEDMP